MGGRKGAACPQPEFVPSPAATAAQMLSHAGQGDTDGVSEGEAATEGDGDTDGGVEEGVALTGEREGVGETTGAGGESEGAGTPAVACVAGMVAFAQVLSAANVDAKSVDEAEALA